MLNEVHAVLKISLTSCSAAEGSSKGRGKLMNRGEESNRNGYDWRDVHWLTP